MTYPLVLDLAADKIPVAVTCRVLATPARRSTNGARTLSHNAIQMMHT
jgi:hypothetical protein